VKVLFSNPPWWGEAKACADPATGRRFIMYTAGIRAGSRWPFTFMLPTPPDSTDCHFQPYPFFMGYATTYLAKRTDADVTFRDSIALRESYDRYYAFLRQEKFDYIIIESASPSWEHDRKLILEIKRLRPDTRIVLTGPITSMGNALLEAAPVHACVRGEYEKGVTRVIEGADGVIDFDLLTLDEMNNSPFPYYDEVIAHRYFDYNPKGQQAPHAQVWSSRGCPFKCIFCVWPATMTGNDPDGSGKRSVRHYTADYMEAFLTELVKKYRYRSIYFDDDTFNLGDKHVERMCGVMRKIGVPWSAMCRADTSRMDLWREMKESGCFGVKIGFESGNQSVVDNIVNKRLNLDYARDVVTELKRLGMTVHGTFTYGLPGETTEQMMDTKRYRDSLGLDTCQESGCAEIEGTPLHSLANQSSLAKYSGAKLDAGYIREVDGRVKYDKIRATLGA
jgi:radical SAM superfamily enzyme YgiQ (UPF0313 family)